MTKIKLYVILVFVLFLYGCTGLDVTKKVETVVDRVYISKECPKFHYQLKMNGRKFDNIIDNNTTSVIITYEQLIDTLEKNKLAREEFNKIVEEMNIVKVVKGIPQTNNYKVVEKRIFVERECPKFTYKPTFNVKKLTNDFRNDTSETFIIIDYDMFITELEKNKMIREEFNLQVDNINRNN